MLAGWKLEKSFGLLLVGSVRSHGSQASATGADAPSAGQHVISIPDINSTVPSAPPIDMSMQLERISSQLERINKASAHSLEIPPAVKMALENHYPVV